MKALLLTIVMLVNLAVANAQAGHKGSRNAAKASKDSGVLMGHSDTLMHRRGMQKIKRAGYNKGKRKSNPTKSTPDSIMR